MILVDASALSASRPGRALFDDLDITVSTGDRIGIVGINGSGKSTLLSVLSGATDPESGSVRRGSTVRSAVLHQATSLDGHTLREALHAGELAEAWEVEAVADRLGLGSNFDDRLDQLSGGQVKRAALARALVTESDLLVLDEPTNHLDIDSIAWLEERLSAYPGALLVVTHDRHFLDRVTTRILELDRGSAFIHEGGYTSYLEARAQREAQADAADAKRRNLARSELAWLRRGAPARTSKPRARIESAERLLAEQKKPDARQGNLPLHAQTPRLGDRVIELHGVAHGFGDRELFSDVELLLDPRERLGVVGVNGSGKSTLLDIMSGRLMPTSGSVDVGSTVKLGVFDQQGRDLDPEMRVREAVAGPDNTVDWTHEALMNAFWFDADAQRARIGTLSGGERRRLQLLLTLAEKPNVLFLDEPTNDLDAETLRQLEDFLEDWPGALVAVSHDRAFLERVVADVIVLGDGTAGRLPGGYSAYQERRRAARAATRAGKVAGEDIARGARVASRGEADAPGSSAAGSSAKASASPEAPTSAPSPSTLRHRLRAAEREVDAVREKCEELRDALAGADTDHEALATLGLELATATEALEAAEETWLELADSVEQRGLEI